MNSTNKKQRFGLPDINIPSEILFNQNLYKTDKLLFGLISKILYAKGKCFATNTYLGGLIGCTTRTISKSIQRLKKENVITIYYTNNRKRQLILKQ